MAVKAGYWFERSGEDASTINSVLFTHLYCAFADFNSQTNLISVSPQCAKFTQTVSQKNSSVKTFLSIGGASVASKDFNTMASQQPSRQTFIQSCINVARSNGFHGIDLDWEGQTLPSEMDNLKVLLAEFREAINVDPQPLLFTMAVASKPTVCTGANKLDWVNVMSYDFYSPTRNPDFTRSQAALNNPTHGTSGSDGINAWITEGVPKYKVVIGLPFYGKAWKLRNPANHGIGDPAEGADDTVGFWNKETPTYDQIRIFIDDHTSTVVYDSDYVTNYCYSNTTWVNYDDTRSISAKVVYAKKKGLLGYFAWSLTQDKNGILPKAASEAWEQKKS